MAIPERAQFRPCKMVLEYGSPSFLPISRLVKKKIMKLFVPCGMIDDCHILLYSLQFGERREQIAVTHATHHFHTVY